MEVGSRGFVSKTVVPQCRHDGLKCAESSEGAGRKGELLAVASEEGECLGTFKASCRGWRGLQYATAPPPGDVLVQK